MNVTFFQLSTTCPNRGGRRLIQKFAVLLPVFLLTAVPALADQVRINQVVQTLTNSQARPELKLNTLAQDPVAPGTGGSTPNGPTNGSTAQKPNQGGVDSDVASGVTISSEGAKLGVDIIEEGEVEGTICDCGEILVAGGAFPKWPFLFLGAVPLVFINTCDDCDTPPQSNSTPTPTPTPTPVSNPTPTPTPPPPQVPEPASLLLFGTGLAAAGAGLRRRYAKARATKQMNAKEEE